MGVVFCWKEPPHPSTWKAAVQTTRIVSSLKNVLRPRRKPISPKMGMPSRPAARMVVWVASDPVVNALLVVMGTCTVTVCVEVEVRDPTVAGVMVPQTIPKLEGFTPGAAMPVPESKPHCGERVTPAGKTKLTLPTLPLVEPEITVNGLDKGRTVTANGTEVRVRPVVGSNPANVTM